MSDIQLINLLNTTTTYTNIDELLLHNNLSQTIPFYQPIGAITFTENGEYGVTPLAIADVEVQEDTEGRAILKTPAVTIIAEDARNLFVVSNPWQNGAFATTLNCYIDNDLVTTKTAGTPGVIPSATIIDSNYVFSDISLYDGKEGEQEIELRYFGEGFVASTPYLYTTTMYSVINNLADYQYQWSSYPMGVKITESNNNNSQVVSGDNITYSADIAVATWYTMPMYLPPEIDVKMNGEDAEYLWYCDTGHATSTVETPMLGSRNMAGHIEVYNITGPVTISITPTQELHLSKVEIEEDEFSGNIIVYPPPYASKIEVFEGDSETPILISNGITYSWEGVTINATPPQTIPITGNPKFMLSSAFDIHYFSSGGVAVSGCQWTRDSSYSDTAVTCTLHLYANETTSLSIDCFQYRSYYGYACTNTYAILSNIDTRFDSTASTEPVENIHTNFKGRNSESPTNVNYSISPGEHTIDAKIIAGANDAVIFSLVPSMLCNELYIDAYDFDEHNYRIEATGQDCVGSTLYYSYQRKPGIMYWGRTIYIFNLTQTTETLRIYIDDILRYDEPYEDSGYGDFNEDITVIYPGITSGAHTMYCEIDVDGTTVTSETVSFTYS